MRTHTTDLDGNKVAQTKISKTVHSKAIRILRVQQGQNINPAFCNECGFRVRNEGHLEGAHHNGRVASCHR